MKRLAFCTCFALLLTAMHAPVHAQPDRVTLMHGQEVFINGINVAWHRYSNDVGDRPLDEEWFTTMLDEVSAAGGNAIRWWLFTNAGFAPKFDENGLVSGPGSATVANIRTVLDLAHQRGIVISLCLFSFDLFQNQQGVDSARNAKMMTTDEGIAAMIDNALLPVVEAIGKHPAIMCWEIFNEPEGMARDVDWAGWATAGSVSITDIQKVINRTAGAIHRAVPGVPVSNGSWCFKVAGNVVTRPETPGFNRNYYSDQALTDAGGDPDGTLDFYQVHYYDWAEQEFSPFHHPASYWKLDKPIVIGEFSAEGFDTEEVSVTPLECYKRLYENGYAGAMSWTYTNHDGHGGLSDAQPGIGYLHENFPEDIVIDFPPLARDDFHACSLESSITVAAPGVLANDTDFTSPSLDAEIIDGSAQGGAVTLERDGSFSFTAASGYRGKASFRYASIDGAGGRDTARVTIQVYDPAQEYFFLVPDADKWAYRDPWQDPAQSDYNLTSDDGLVIRAKQWGPASAWVIDAGDGIRLEAQKEYTVRFRFSDDPLSGLQDLGFTFVTEWERYGPTDSLFPTISAGKPTSGDFSEHTVRFTAPESGSYHMAWHLLWEADGDHGPKTDYQAVLRDILVSPLAPGSSVRLVPAGAGSFSATLSNGILSVPRSGHAPVTVSIYAVDGRQLRSVSAAPAADLTLDLRRLGCSAGAYILRVQSGAGETRTFPAILGR